MAVVIFTEIEKSALEDILKQQEAVRERKIREEDFRESILYGKTNYISIPEEGKAGRKISYDVIFHQVTRQKELSDLTTTEDYDMIIPVIPNPIIPNAEIESDDEYIITNLKWLQSRNNSITTLAIPDFREKKMVIHGNTINVSPTLTLYTLQKQEQGEKELIRTPRYNFIPQEEFYTEGFYVKGFENPNQMKEFFENLRTEINKANYLSNHYN